MFYCSNTKVHMYFDDALEKIGTLLSQVKKDDMKIVLEDMFTPAEICEVWERINLLQELESWKTQREISDELWISVTTVSRGSRVLKYGKWWIRKYL